MAGDIDLQVVIRDIDGANFFFFDDDDVFRSVVCVRLPWCVR